MTRSMDQEASDETQRLINRIRATRIPSLRPNAYACIVRDRSSEDVATELNACVRDLPKAESFDTLMEFLDDIEFDQSGDSRPEPEDFPTEAAYDEAADAVLEKYDRSLPWIEIRKDLRLAVRQLFSWDVNDRSYVLKDELGEQSNVDVTFDSPSSEWTARVPNQLHHYEQLERLHQQAIDELVSNLMRLVDGGETRLFEAEHLLLDPDDYGWICFFDKALAVLSHRHAILLWAGFDGWYG